ncbi:hypothetical protein HHX47_DHR1000972 [Lentinula edodes]|nr:hypothetical protein HHX47_DHR1000972 [Lentinula edodes]
MESTYYDVESSYLPEFGIVPSFSNSLDECNSYINWSNAQSFIDNTLERMDHAPTGTDMQDLVYCEPGESECSKEQWEKEEVQHIGSETGTTHASMEQTDPAKVGSSAGRAAAERRRIAHPTGGRNPSRFFCTIPGCGAQFTAKHNYNYHVNAHNKIRRFQCNACKNRYPSMNNLKRHWRTCKGTKGARSV